MDFLNMSVLNENPVFIEKRLNTLRRLLMETLKVVDIAKQEVANTKAQLETERAKVNALDTRLKTLENKNAVRA